MYIRYFSAARQDAARRRAGIIGRFCRWCGKELKDRRRTFCSKDCVDAWLWRSRIFHEEVLEASQGRCALCATPLSLWPYISSYVNGLTAASDPLDVCQTIEKVARENFSPRHFLEWMRHMPRLESWVRDYLPCRSWAPNDKLFWGGLCFYWWCVRWEADHALPVALGGGACPQSNLRALCQACHTTATRELRQVLKVMEDAARRKLRCDRCGDDIRERHAVLLEKIAEEGRGALQKVGLDPDDFRGRSVQLSQLYGARFPTPPGSLEEARDWLLRDPDAAQCVCTVCCQKEDDDVIIFPGKEKAAP